jgi:hypothetical protein
VGWRDRVSGEVGNGQRGTGNGNRGTVG